MLFEDQKKRTVYSVTDPENERNEDTGTNANDNNYTWPPFRLGQLRLVVELDRWFIMRLFSKLITLLCSGKLSISLSLEHNHHYKCI